MKIVPLLFFLTLLFVLSFRAQSNAVDKVVFTSQRDGNSEIYLMSPLGANQTRLTNNPASDDSPEFSPNGRKILFSSKRANGFDQLYTMNIDGSNPIRLTDSSFNDHLGSWSPDGSKIAFGRCNADYSLCDNYIMNADGSNIQPLNNSPQDDDNPRFIPNTSDLIFESNRDGDYEIYRINLFGGVPVQLTNNTSHDNYADVSADGSKIVFSSLRDATNYELYLMNSNGSNQTRLTNLPVNDFGAAFSPDGTRVIWANGTTGNYEIVGVILPSTGTPVTSFYNLTSNSASDIQPDWASSFKSYFDFDGDLKTDISIFRPNAGEWWYLRSLSGDYVALPFGGGTDKIVPADYTGDDRTDVAVYRDGEWFILRSEDFSFYSFPFGTSGDVPQPADFDGDFKADAAVFRPSNGTWYILRSSGGITVEQFGANGDKPVVGDYDGDQKADTAIYRPSNGQWWVNRSSLGLLATPFGAPTDTPVPADYTGDGKTDVAFWRSSSGEWFVLRSENFTYYSFPFGANGDIPSLGDYDGDGRADAGIFRPSNSTWYVLRTSSGTLIQTFGATGDKPVPSAFVP